MSNRLNWSIAHAQITDEIINVSSSVAFGLFHDIFYSKTAKPVVISTSAGGAGTVLVNGTDYNIGGAVTSFPANITDPTPDVPYTTVAIINATYQSTNLYVSYYPFGDYVEAEDFTQLATGIRLATKDISSANQTTDLSVYGPGGSAHMQDGGKIHVSWTGGDATYYHKFTTTSGWTIKSNFVDLAAGDGSSTYAWCGYGTGGLTLVKDEANSRWIVETEGCFDKGRNSQGRWSYYTDRNGILSMELSGSGVTLHNLPVRLDSSQNYRCVGSSNDSTTAADVTCKFSSKLNTRVSTTITANGTYSEVTIDCIIQGEWMD